MKTVPLKMNTKLWSRKPNKVEKAAYGLPGRDRIVNFHLESVVQFFFILLDY